VFVAGAAALALATPAAASPPADPVAELRSFVEMLAADGMRGRGAGTPELERARDLVRAAFEEAGLSPGLPDGWLQVFDGEGGARFANVVGKVPGRGDEWIVVGAHYDGLGVGALGSEHAGLVRPGADDNASGVAALVQVARALAADADLERTVWVVAFSGEETGLQGSRWFAEHPPADPRAAAAMLNLDTVGRIENGRLIVFGTATAEEFPAILAGANHAFGFDLAGNSEGASASDHTPFFEKGIPVLHFFSGAKPEYHRPGDRPELLDYEGLARLAGYVTEVVTYLAASGDPLTFRPAGVERLAQAPPGSKPRRVSFGSIPDFSRESGGILLSGVMPGSPAETAGLAAGDLLVEMDGRTIDNIQDFQAALAGRHPGEAVSVRYVRAGETLEAKVTLAERK
jgi:hypothetical protein